MCKRALTYRLQVFILLLSFMVVGCGKKKGEDPVVVRAEPKPLVQVGDHEITEEDFAFEIQRRSEKGRSTDHPKEILDDLIQRKVMLIHAEKSGVLDDPAVQRSVENLTLSQWLDRTVNEEKQKVRATDDDLMDMYESEIDRYTQPAMARLAILLRTVSPGDAEETKNALKEELRSAVATFQENPEKATRNGRLTGFGAVAVEASEHTVSRYRGGDLGWIKESQNITRWPEEVIDMGFSLNVGDISDILDVDNQLYVVMKTDWRESTVTPFDEAKISMRRKVIREKQENLERTFISNLMASVSIEINAEKAEALEVPASPDPEAPTLLPLHQQVPSTVLNP